MTRIRRKYRIKQEREDRHIKRATVNQPSTVSYNCCWSVPGKKLFQKKAAPSTTAAAASLFSMLLSFLLLLGDGTSEEGVE